MLTKEELPECPVATTVALIGSKWKLLIIRNLLQRPWRFNELKRDLTGISQKVLTNSLRSMEEDGLITRPGALALSFLCCLGCFLQLSLLCLLSHE